MVVNIFTVGCLVLGVVSGVLSLNNEDALAVVSGVVSLGNDNAVVRAEPLATGLEAQASIWLVKKAGTRAGNVFLCSAAIIETDHVLAHAKCIEYYSSSKLVVALGKADLSTTLTFYEVMNITYEDDTEMALIRTEAAAFPTTSVAALRNKPLGNDSQCVVSGWLDSKTPWKQLNVTYIADSECKEQYEATQAAVEEGNICAQGPPTQCGSLGMPLTCDDQLTGLFSITDWACKLPAQCAGVPHSKAWIQKQLALARGGASSMRPSLFAAIAALLVAYKTFA